MGRTFYYSTGGTYQVKDEKLSFNEKNPQVQVTSSLGNFDMPGDITCEVKEGSLHVILKASNEADTYELAHFIIGKEQAKKLGIGGVTSKSKKDEPVKDKKDEKKQTQQTARLT